ncbi:MAG: alpha/beta superfamily hydrolase [Rickettsiales bacterium]|jgi:alpha/beta superfamily hydrolase
MPEVIITGPAGKIEGRYHQNKDIKAPVALVLHPHPLHGGTMNNKITYHLFKSFVDNGFSVLRINFRGVGKSEGVFNDGVGELQDATAALNWLHSKNMEASIFWLAGFSFGSWVGLQAIMRRPDIERYILAAPPASKYSFNFIVPCSASGMIIQGTSDDISLEKDSSKIADKLNLREEAEIKYNVVPDANHFFSNHLSEFDRLTDDYIKESILEDSGKVKKVKRDRRRRRRKKKDTPLTRSEQYRSPIKPLSSL